MFIRGGKEVVGCSCAAPPPAEKRTMCISGHDYIVVFCTKVLYIHARPGESSISRRIETYKKLLAVLSLLDVEPLSFLLPRHCTYARTHTPSLDTEQKMPVVQPEKLVKLQQAGDTIRNVSSSHRPHCEQKSADCASRRFASWRTLITARRLSLMD